MPEKKLWRQGDDPFDPDLYYDPVETKGWLDHEVDCICDDPSEYLCAQRLFEPECMCECHGGWE